jgi:transcription antitermination factor NusG
MQKLHSQYKIVPPKEEYAQYNWYIAFVQVISNIRKVESILDNMSVNYRLWAPSYQEYCKIYFELVLVDRLLYPGYIVVGLQGDSSFEILHHELISNQFGYLLGDRTTNVKPDEFLQMLRVSSNILAAPVGQFNVKVGDNIVISAGPCAGLHGVVKAISDDGQVTLAVFFMNREISVITSVTDVQNLGGPLNDTV